MVDNTAELNKINKTLLEIAQNMQPGMFKATGEKNEEVVAAIKAASDKEAALSKEEQKLYDKLQKSLNLKKEFAGLTDVMKLRGEKTQYAKFVNKLGEMTKEKYENIGKFEDALKELEEAAIAAGTTLKKEGIESFKPLHNMNQKFTMVIKDGVNVHEELHKKVTEEIAEIDKVTEHAKKMKDQFDRTKAGLVEFGGVIKTIGKDFLKFAESEQRFAQATATADAGWIDGLTKMGISQIEYMKILKDTRQESLAAAAGGVDFKASLSASAESLQGMTSSYSEAAKGAAFFHKNMARIGVSQDQLGDAVAQQTTMYEKNYRALGYTVEEFANLTNELINDQGMRSTLLGLQESERKAYILSVQQRQAEYLTMGYTIERAKELQKTFQALNKQSPKERMKDAARQRAMMGAMGMGGEGARLFDLKTRYRTMGPQEKAAAEKEMTEIQAAASKKFGQMSGSGVGMGQAMVMQTMADKTGFTQIADTFETETAQGLKFASDQLDTTNEISDTIKNILGKVDLWQAASNSAIGSIGTTVATTLGTMLLGKIGGSMAAKLAGGMASMGGGSGLISGIGQGIKGAGVKMAGMGMAGASMLGTGAVKGAGMLKTGAGAAGNAVAKGLSKGAAKTALKAIPGIGLIASLGFMGSRIMDGDYVGAGMELAAGGMGLLPGLGTAGSIGMSGAIVARDLSKSAGPEGTSEIEDTTMASAASKETILSELNATLLSLNDYLIGANTTGSDQVKAIDKQTLALREEQRMNNALGARHST